MKNPVFPKGSFKSGYLDINVKMQFLCQFYQSMIYRRVSGCLPALLNNFRNDMTIINGKLGWHTGNKVGNFGILTWQRGISIYLLFAEYYFAGFAYNVIGIKGLGHIQVGSDFRAF